MVHFSRGALFAVAAASLAFVAGGEPLLRHDWFPIVPALRFAVDNATGWDPTGMGSAVGYPASFLMVFARSTVAAFAGSYVAHVAYFATYGLVLAFGAARLASVLGAPASARVAAALFASFNPWTYVQLVAGHGFTLLSYAATFWLVAELCSRSRSALRLTVLAIAIAPQIQFLIVDALAYAWLSARMRSWATIAAIAAMLLPVAVGVIASRSVLVGIPLTLAWEKGQSIDPLRGVILRGYFTRYDVPLAPYFEWALWVVVGIACVGVVTIAVTQRRRLWLIAFAAIPLFWSFGTLGPFRDAFTWTIAHVPETALFRELYTLLGFVAIGYVALCAVAAARIRALGIAWLFAGGAMLVAWVGAPPDRYWVTSRVIPPTSVAGQPNTRFLLTPPLYPLRLAGRGSGTDPDLYGHDAGVTPVNEAIATYPLSPAIGRFLRDGSTAGLGALGVTNVIARPWFETDPTIRYQLALPPPDWLEREPTGSMAIAKAVPELALTALPAVGTLEDTFGSGNILFGDARNAAGDGVPPAWRAFAAVRSVTPGIAFVKASDGWVDARLAFVEDPELAQPYGGAVTTNRVALLDVQPNAYALVFVRGGLSGDDGAEIASTSAGFRWVFVPPTVRAVKCSGLCVVAAQTARVPDAPLDPPAHPTEAVAFRLWVPWFVTATLPAEATPLLRYAVTYDPHWMALYAGRALPHLRIDGAVNGWIVPARTLPTSVILIETGAAWTALAEIVSVLGIATLVALCFRERRRGASLRDGGYGEQ